MKGVHTCMDVQYVCMYVHTYVLKSCLGSPLFHWLLYFRAIVYSAFLSSVLMKKNHVPEVYFPYCNSNQFHKHLVLNFETIIILTQKTAVTLSPTAQLAPFVKL